MRRSSQSGNQQPKQHLLSGLQCRKRLVADILFWDGKQWGTTERPANYTVAAQLPIAYTSTAYIILGIGIVAPDDNNAKNVSNIYNLTTKTSVSFRTENENAPSVRYIAIGR